ncbi:hypothetical protein AC578_5658 [Pseudocercospora eumusae]|uniref:Protein kinase domain-containing protein n=1 Tax=Pseudocercospora eumusae TaxID=321146 RepID=A0A139HT19_9PEZI|nr:hypothetical protein AC578_5658 [Pseudocercospora eumusae]
MSSAAVSPQQYNPPTSPIAPLSSSPPASRRAAARQPDHAHIPSEPPYTASPPMSNTPRQSHQPGASMSSSTYQQFYPEPSAASSSLPMPNASLPIRNSAQQTPASTSTASYDNRAYSSSRAHSSHGQSGYGNDTSDGERRRTAPGHRSPQPDTGSGRGQRTRNAPTASRSQTAMGQPPMGTDLPRENSAVINRIVVDDPQTDIRREEARKAEARGVDPSSQLANMNLNDAAEPAPVPRSRQEHLKHSSSHRKEVKFGDYILGQTIGEGEFGKVKMGWKKDSTVQVAIKLIRKESLAGNTTRLPKIYREISILRELQHPNIVRLHEFVETERHMGIILEYASGGELFDYILNHRYLKDPAARRLFAQLVSGVGYLHKKGIVHRDLKLENLLLDRNKHIIITDFGFANTFDPDDELGEDTENRIADKDFVKRQGLDKIIPWVDGREGGHRRGDLMQTSCGSPCYAAPELVVSDGLYTGRKVDVWSCGVILYAMLAGYLPFDDDPANPEGDNINLLYKYIVSTPLTFPEYVTPHARDLLRRILVPDPRRRADLFEVARHSWLSEYTHVVGFIGSRVKSEKDLGGTLLQIDDDAVLGRSASVREPASRPHAERSVSSQGPKHMPAASMGGDEASDIRKQQRDAKRRTVQVEYVAPQGATIRGDAGSPADASARKAVPGSSSGRTRARAEGQGPVEVTQQQRQDNSVQPPPSRSGRDHSKDASSPFAAAASSSMPRPNTSGTLGVASRLPSRGNSYSQPAAAQPTNTTAQGSFSQPKSSSGYIIAGSGPMSSENVDASGRPQSEQAHSSGHYQRPQSYSSAKSPGHRRSSTLGSLADKVLNRSNSKRQSSQQQEPAQITSEKRDRRKYPPVSMKNAMPNAGEEPRPRMSSDSRRPSFGFARKASREGSVQGPRSSRRFSWLLPASMSVNNILGSAGKKETGYDSGDDGYRPPNSQQSNQSRTARPESKGTAFGRGASDSPSQSTINSAIPVYYEEEREKARDQRRGSNAPGSSRYDKALPPSPGPFPTPPPVQRKQFRDDGYGSNRLELSSQGQDPLERFYTPDPGMASSSAQPQDGDQYNIGSNGEWERYGGQQSSPPRQPRDQSLRPQNRKFENAYDHGHGGSSSATRRVMDFFRRRGRDRNEA